jgi:hypothetical protein
MSKNIFVFVVCGASEHIDTLQFSLKFLNKFSKKEIYVVTDSKRNEVPVVFDKVIDIQTPSEFTNHQASIYLKTGLHKFLPKGNTYCYLDTDVIALSDECDKIFNEFISPIRFAPDHCTLRKFSPYATNCNCLERWQKERLIFNQSLDRHDKNRHIEDPFIRQKAKELQFYFDDLKKSLPRKVSTALRYFTSFPKFRLNNDYYFDKKKRTWHLASGETIMYEVDVRKIQQETGLKYNRWKQQWLNKQGENIWQDECDHLIEQIKNTFNIEVKNNNWQHWNGGVFLFNDSSNEFMETWFNKTMHIFSLPEWKTRDQGTLIATAWEFGLDKQSTLSKKWNFIADFYNKGLVLDIEENMISDDGCKIKYKPAFVHIYHHWGDTSWDVWNWVKSIL